MNSKCITNTYKSLLLIIVATITTLLKVTTLVIFFIANYFVSLQALKLYTNASNFYGVLCIEKERRVLLKFKEGLEDPLAFFLPGLATITVHGRALAAAT
ncbi:hypothetical protein LguiB_013021 [Lonicera macranthoides]